MKCFRDVVITLRLGVLSLNANLFRYAHENTLKILCSFCENEIEDEIRCLASVQYKKNFVRNISIHICEMENRLRT